ncbi:hypothetical protein SeMB42_g01445 [Synchytrium endobioticum]|uniref:glutaminase n=1 Tax=Synchytrium endobioticum TaxID=286115 RepID=A0A507DLI7_9FUNG|nr:hypothetical protein SeLEV6574_g02800 [Synchytrium endobioticum]TPX52386.1 hypothetical protein SeMB42_g01445 [Synchytrium endobioticum]
MTDVKPIRIGVLALQGAFTEHLHHFAKLSTPAQPIDARAVRTSAQLDDIDALVIPGGESTSMCILAEKSGLLEPLRAWTRRRPVWGTCAGMILLANAVVGAAPILGGLDVTVRRNAFGTQVDSFAAELQLGGPMAGGAPFPGVFIRAPVVEAVTGDVHVLCTLADDAVVAVRQGLVLATAFHPELTRDDRLHRYFVDMIIGAGQ